MYQADEEQSTNFYKEKDLTERSKYYERINQNPSDSLFLKHFLLIKLTFWFNAKIVAAKIVLDISFFR